MEYCIYLKCNDGSGYFTGISLTSNGREVLVHPSIYRARVFEDRNEAFSTARQLKAAFRCILSYEIKNR